MAAAAHDGSGERGERFLVYGGTGWIGGMLAELLARSGRAFELGAARLEDRASILADIDRFRPTRVLNAAGVTGRPNVDWCEANRAACVRGNVVAPLNVADACRERGVHLTYFGTGCIYEYDADHPVGAAPGFAESDPPNFTASYYSRCKAAAEGLLAAYDDVLTLRVRMPIVRDLSHPRNFVTKILRYDRVVDVPNSMTVLDELLPMAVALSERRATGVINFVNPGVVSHNEILRMYKEHVDPDYEWTNFTLQEQAAVVAAPRSNNRLDASRLRAEFPEVLDVRESLLKHVFCKITNTSG